MARKEREARNWKKLRKWSVSEVPAREYLRNARPAHQDLQDGCRLVVIKWHYDAHAMVLMEDLEVLEALLELDPLTLVEVSASIDDVDQKRALARVINWVDNVR